MVFENVESIFIDNKEVQSIVVKDSGGILFEKRAAEPLIFTFTGTTLTQYSSGSFSGTNMIIDYGDGTIESTTGKFGHTYERSGTYEIKIYGVISLGNSCFRNCTGLTSINIPSSVTSIGVSCFSGCTDLTSINIPSSVTNIGVNCFLSCTGLTSITIPSSVTSLENHCFRNCTGLTSINIPSSVTSIGVSCFSGCTGLTSINIPSSVTNIGISCFSSCTGLTSITIPSSITSIGNYCFQRCTSLTSIQLNWITTSTIITYNSTWIANTSSTLKLHIPAGTTQLYVDKGYPSDKLIEDALYDNIRHVFVIPRYDTRIDVENGGNYRVSEFARIYNEGDSISDIKEDIETPTDSYGNYFIFSAPYMDMELDQFYDYEYTGDYDTIFDYYNYGFCYNGYDTDLGALIFTQSLSQANGVLLFFTDNGATLDCSISNDDTNQVTVFTWTVSEKIDTEFIINKSELWLQDINGNGLMNKTIIVQICSKGSIETVTVTTASDGLTNISGNNVKDATFDGDDEYNGCSYTNPNFLCKGTIK